MSALPMNWHKWVIECVLKGCDFIEVADILIANGFTLEQVKLAMGTNFPKGYTSYRNQAHYQKLSTPKLIQQLEALASGKSQEHAYSVQYIESEKAQLLKIENFLDADTCTEIVALAKQHLRPSTISAESGYDEFRTSSTCDLPFLKQAVANAVDQKIIDMLGLGLGETEIIQAQHYAVGQQFKAHTDYFEPGADEYKTYATDRGQRTWTVMVYLNSECTGGETEFVKLGYKFKPQTGMALIWNNLYADGTPNPNTLHQAHPVTKGEKVVITKWFRDKDYP